MNDLTEMNGIVLKSEPYGEYDRRLVLLTKEAGKITAFARGARKTSSRLLAPTNLFCFGKFKLYPTRSAYNLIEADISNFFDDLRKDFTAAYYGMFFLELADYYSVENMEAEELLILLYLSLKALGNDHIPRELVRVIFEIRAQYINGEFPGAPEEALNDTKYTVQHITGSPYEKLFTFIVSEEVMNELTSMTEHYRNKYIGRHFNSLEILKTLQE